MAGHVGMSGEDGGDIFIRLSRVNDGGFLCLGCQGELGLEGPVLQRTRGMIVMEVETYLPHSHDMGVLQQLAKPLLGIRAPARVRREDERRP